MLRFQLEQNAHCILNACLQIAIVSLPGFRKELAI